MPGPVKHTERSATIAFSSNVSEAVGGSGGRYLACGTMAGAIDLSFSTSSVLEVFAVDMDDDSGSGAYSNGYGGSDSVGGMRLVGKPVHAPERFNRLIWGPPGDGGSAGLLAGGLVDGSVCLWDAASIIADSGAKAGGGEKNYLLATLEKHAAGAVRGLDFNSFNKNLLASGGTDGEVCIWDVCDPSKPSLHPAMKGGSANTANGGGGSGGGGEISSLAWNCRVQHILASTGSSGTTVIWDLKKQKPVMSLTDPSSRRRCSCLQWNPDVATQVIVASDDDRSPGLQVWDLRNSISPLKELRNGHTKGVLSMAWCKQDTSLLLTCGKDNRTLCWDVHSGEIVLEVPGSSNWNFDVCWSPCVPGLIGTASFDAHVSLYNIMDCAPEPPMEGTAVPDAEKYRLKKAPSWMKRPSGVSFGFGGQLARFGIEESGKSDVAVTEIAQESGDFLATKSEELQQALSDRSKGVLGEFCDTKTKSAATREEEETWAFMKILYDEDGRKTLMRYFGFPEPTPVVEEVPEQQAALDTAAAQLSAAAAQMEADAGIAASQVQSMSLTSAVGDGADFFDDLDAEPEKPAVVEPEPAPASKTSAEAKPTPAENGVSSPMDAPASSFSTTGEDDIQRNLIIGDYPAAASVAMKAGRIADALVVASIGGQDLWKKTLNEYMAMAHLPYMKLVSAISSGDIATLIKGRAPGDWKDTLGLICTYASQDDWPKLCKELGDSLHASGMMHAALLCFMCAGDVDSAVRIWSTSLQGMVGDARASMLYAIVEKALLLQLSVPSGRETAAGMMSNLLDEYTLMLTGEGRDSIAMSFIQMFPEDSVGSIAAIQDRIAKSKKADKIQPMASAPAAASSNPYQHSNGYGNAHYGATAAQQSSYGQPAYRPAPTPQTFQPQPTYTPPMASPPPPVAAYQPAAPQASPQPAVFQPQAPPPAPYQPQQPPAPPPPAPYQPQQPPAPTPAPYQPQQPPAPTPAPYQPQQPPAPTPAPYQPQQPPAPTPAPYQPQQPPVQPGLFVPSAAQPAGQPAPKPAAPPPRKPAEPPAPPPTVETVDVSKVSAELQPIVQSLRSLFDTCKSMSGQSGAKKREMEDNSKKLGALFAKLNAGDVSPGVVEKLKQFCAAISAGDLSGASAAQVSLTTSDWSECSAWLQALKRLLKTYSGR